jgi:hypothetical protein
MSWKVTCHLLDIGESVIAISGDGDCLVVKVEVTSISVGPNIGLQELHVEDVSIDKGGKDMKVIVGSVEPNKDCSIDCAQSEDDCSGETGAMGWECGGERHRDAVRGESGDWNGDGLSLGRNSGSFKLVVLMALKSLIRSGAKISDLLTHELCEGE